jgi:hypothetical protein
MTGKGKKGDIMCFGRSKKPNRTDGERLRQLVKIFATNDFMQK